MTLEIKSADETAVPQRVYLELWCDWCGEGAVCLIGAGYIQQRKYAHTLGWKFDPEGEVFGPCCKDAWPHRRLQDRRTRGNSLFNPIRDGGRME